MRTLHVAAKVHVHQGVYGPIEMVNAACLSLDASGQHLVFHQKTDGEAHVWIGHWDFMCHVVASEEQTCPPDAGTAVEAEALDTMPEAASLPAAPVGTQAKDKLPPNVTRHKGSRVSKGWFVSYYACFLLQVAGGTHTWRMGT